MPKLRHPYLTKGMAIACLLDLYRNEPEFVKELEEIRHPYMPLLFDLSKALLNFWAECKKVLPSQDYWAYVAYFQGKNQHVPNLPAKLDEQRKNMEQLWERLKPYKSALADFAFKWKLRAAWAIQTLLYYDIFDFATVTGLPMQIDVPLESLDDLYPWPLIIPPLEIKVSAYALIHSGRKEVQIEIAKRLKDYENEIKATGLKEYPSALKTHAQWWFEHYVHKKKYPELANEFPSCNEVNRQENIKRAVSNFSKLIEIKVKK